MVKIFLNNVLSALVIGICFIPFFVSIPLVIFLNGYDNQHNWLIIGVIGFIFSLMLFIAKGISFIEKRGWLGNAHGDVGDSDQTKGNTAR
ncbi:hypothetical protein D4R49_01100 [bacterium]|nr:MAG: hypothetical protein D4R49_01100 [bacterium]